MPHSSSKTAFLYLQLSTPQRASFFSVFIFLYRFLTDWRVIDLPKVLRWIVVTLFIIPLRLRAVTKAYSSIWTAKGSPLGVYSEQLISTLKRQHPEENIELAMTYDRGAIKNALERLQQSRPDRIIVLPLFPQYAASTAGSALSQVYQEAAKLWDPPALVVKKDFYSDRGFIEASVALIIPHLHTDIDLLILSFHGLPIHHLKQSGCPVTASCQSKRCPKERGTTSCYRAQCYRTAEAIIKALPRTLASEVVFQSRIGRLPWIEPNLVDQVSRWKAEGRRHIMIAMPSFTADCLETLEEIEIRFKAEWIEAVPEGSVRVISCVNASEIWVKVLSRWMMGMKNLNMSLPRADISDVRHKRESSDSDAQAREP